MSTVTAVPIQPLKRGSLAKLLLGIALLVAAGLLLAWAGAGRMRGSDVGDGLIVRTIRPGHGLPPKFLSEILGRRASRPLECGTPLTWDVIGGV